MAGKSQKQLRLRLPSPPPLALPPGELSAQPTERGTQPHSPPPAKTRRPLRLHRRRGLRFSEKSLAAFAARRRQIKCNPFFAAACTSQKTLLIPKPVKKLEKLFIAPKVRQVLYETSQRVFTRCVCARRTGFLIKFFNQESVSVCKCGICSLSANKLCAQQTASLLSKKGKALFG